MKPVKISQLIEAFEFASEEVLFWVDLKNGSVEMVERAALSAAEQGDEEMLRDDDESAAEIVRAIAADSGERFVRAPTKFEFHEYRHMERFIGTVDDAAAADQLWRAIKGKGAFRHFKDTANRLGLLEQWYRYRDAAMKKFAIEWADAKKVDYVDDVRAS